METTTTAPTLQNLSDRCAILFAARDHQPERLSPVASEVLEAHQRVMAELGMDNHADIYDLTAEGSKARLALAEALPIKAGWWQDDAVSAAAPKYKRTMSDIRALRG